MRGVFHAVIVLFFGSNVFTISVRRVSTAFTSAVARSLLGLSAASRLSSSVRAEAMAS